MKSKYPGSRKRHSLLKTYYHSDTVKIKVTIDINKTIPLPISEFRIENIYPFIL